MRDNIVVLTCIAIGALLFVSVFSYTTSPLYDIYADAPDSPIFQIVGKYWAEGAVPYRDLWDMKGPYVFFNNAIGYELTGTRHGVWLVQTITMFFTLLALFKLFRLYFSAYPSLWLMLLCMAALSYVYDGGNMTEEYVLPWLAFSFFQVTLWVKAYSDGVVVSHKHSPMSALLYGITFGLCLLSRLTNALALSGAILVITLSLMNDKYYKNLFQNVVAFLVGFAASVLPFVVYFAHHQSLQQMWNATFAYATQYLGMSSADVFSNGVHYFLLSYIGCILLLGLAFYRMVVRRRMDVQSWLWTLSAGLPFIWFLLGNGYSHYGMTVLPLVAISLTQIVMLRLSKLRIVVLAAILVGCASKLLFMTVICDYENKNVAAYRAFLHECPDVDYTSFVAYNCDPNIYLDLNVKPATPYFALQDMAQSHTKSLPNDIAEAFMENKPEWVLLFSPPTLPSPIVSPILSAYYIVIQQKAEQYLTLYRRRGLGDAAEPKQEGGGEGSAEP